MPWKLEPAGKGKYFVVTEATGRKHSKKPLARAMALRQMKALYVSERK